MIEGLKFFSSNHDAYAYVYDGSQYYNISTSEHLLVTELPCELIEITNDLYNIVLLEAYYAKLPVQFGRLFLRIYNADYKISVDFYNHDIRILDFHSFRLQRVCYASYVSLFDLFRMVK